MHYVFYFHFKYVLYYRQEVKKKGQSRLFKFLKQREQVSLASVSGAELLFTNLFPYMV